MRSIIYFSLAAITLVIVSCTSPTTTPDKAATDVSTAGIDRTVLPIKEPTYPAITELDARNAKAPARFEVKAPEKAPNVVIVLLDDIGYGHSSAFGGPINMPTLEKLAGNGPGRHCLRGITIIPIMQVRSWKWQPRFPVIRVFVRSPSRPLLLFFV
jgi:hypothetical protein